MFIHYSDVHTLFVQQFFKQINFEMENADALDLSKENIQPLKRGRNTAQLGLALQAQTDTTLHQMLSKKQEWYEMQIRTYEGSDPLELWCEYISWVEQSFPKHGPEGNLSVLLTKCFQAFKDEERYKNDIRFVRLWIKYVEMQNDGKRVELYQLLHTQGIGLRCAEFYRCWAYEFECVGDWKQADQIYKKGSNLMAQPAEELEAAHQQFLATYVFTHKNDAPEEQVENHVQNDHRLPMAALKPVGKKSAAPTVRVGSNVRSQAPGVVPTVQGSSGRSTGSSRTFGVRGNNAGPVTIYQGDSDAEMHHGQIVPSALPIPQSLNKENVVKAGPWSGQGLGSRKHQSQSTSVAPSFTPRQPGFEVHRDEEADVVNDHDMRSYGMVVPNVLKPRKGLEDGFHDAIAIFEEPRADTKAMYRKNEVYAGGKELQLEELHAIDYFRQRSEKQKKMREIPVHSDQGEQSTIHPRKLNSMGNTQSPIGMGLMTHSDYPPRDVHGPFYGDRQMIAENIDGHPFRQSCSPVNVAPAVTNYHQLQPPSGYGTAPTAESLVHYNTELPCHEQPPLGQRFQPSNQSMYNQSMTLHTKLAMHEVNNLWGSPTVVKTPTDEPALPGPASGTLYQPAFQIMKDNSLPPQTCENSARLVELQPHNQYPKPSVEGVTSGALGNNQPSSVLNVGQSAENHKMGMYPSAPPHTYAGPFEDPMTSYMKQPNGFQVFQEEPCPPINSSIHRGKFQVFCDDTESNMPMRTYSSERGDLSSSAHTSSSIQKVAKEKENIHKFPQADIELMEECGVAPVVESPERRAQQEHPNHYNAPASTCNSQLHSDPGVYSSQHSQEPMQPISTYAQETMQSTSEVIYNAMQPAPMAYELMQTGPMSSDPYANQEPMDDDATVSAAPNYGVNMSETGITEAFFFPKMSAASTPFQTSPKKSRASRNTIDFNSSLYRVEQSWPDEEDDGPDGSNKSSNTPKTVPPLKLFRIKNDEEKQLSAIMEASREKYQSTMMSNTSSRNSLCSASSMSRFGMFPAQGQSVAPQPCLNQIDESPEPSSSSQDGQPQNPVPAPVQMPGPDPQQMNEMAARVARGEINPFDSRMLTYFLTHMGFPLAHHAAGYFVVNAAVPAKRNNCLNLNGDVYTISKTLGEGAYAKVLRGVNVNTQQEVALKIQKPSCRWEYYICREIQHRLSQRDLASAFMPADRIYVYNNGSVIVTDLLPFGTLLNLVNKVVASTKRQMLELQVLFLLDQLISAVAALHSCKIIHGDLKPDNILIRSIPAVDQLVPCIQLIDFGRSIDMNLVPEGTTFNQVVMTDTFTCIEMRTNKPWTYQTDLFGLANTAHCLLLGDYMKVQESRSTGRWTIHSRLPRNVNSDLWNPFFDTLLNIESCDAIPSLETLQADIKGSMNNTAHLSLAVSALGRILLSR